MKIISLFLFLFFAIAASAQSPDICAPRTFFKEIGGLEDMWTFGTTLCLSDDSNLYLSVDRVTSNGRRPVLMKITPTGKVLWSRLFLRHDSPHAIHITDMIVDSEGMLFVAGRYDFISPFINKDLLCRYDPVRDSVLWLKRLISPQVTSISRVLEKHPGGHYLLSRILRVGDDGRETELLEVNRQTGAIIHANSRKIGWAENTELRSVLAYQGALYAAGNQGRYMDNRGDHLLCKIELTGTQLAWGNIGPGIPEEVLNVDLLIDQDTLVSLYVGRDTLPTSSDQYIYLQKTTLDGSPVWARRYELPENTVSLFPLSVVASTSGYLIFGVNRYASNTQQGDYFILTTDKAGHVQRSCRIPTPPPFEQAHGVNGATGDFVITAGESFYFIGTFFRSTLQPIYQQFYRAVLVKADIALTAIDSCPFAPLASSIVEKSIVNPVAIPISLTLSAVTSHSNNITIFTLSDSLKEHTQCVRCDEPCGLVLSLGPDQEFFADTTLLLQAGAGYACYLWQNGSTAPQFPAAAGGTYWVEVKDGCGFVQRDTVHLALSETVCDRKELACLRWDLLEVQATATGERRFRIKLTNDCAAGVQQISFQVPAGLTAVQPADQSMYVAPSSGRSYTVRNPNFSPFYSVRFKANGGALQNGAADIFAYDLPAQAAPDYIHTAVKLADGSSYSALLNTFHCPPAAAGNRAGANAGSINAVLSPNHSTGTLWLQLPAWPEQSLQVRILNAQGQLLQTMQMPGGEQQQTLVLDGRLANGLYYALVQSENEAPLTLRFVLAR